MSKPKEEAESKSMRYTPIKLVLQQALDAMRKADGDVLNLENHTTEEYDSIAAQAQKQHEEMVTERMRAFRDKSTDEQAEIRSRIAGSISIEPIRHAILTRTPKDRRNAAKRQEQKNATTLLHTAIEAFLSSLKADLTNAKADIALDRVKAYGGQSDIQIARTLISMADVLDSDQQPDATQVAASRMKGREEAAGTRHAFNPAKDY